LIGEIQSSFEWDSTHFQQAPQGGAFHKFHDHNQVIIQPEGMMYGGDIGVIQAGLKPNLA
jgi:hypothetical protein